jgi:hypothetical protein
VHECLEKAHNNPQNTGALKSMLGEQFGVDVGVFHRHLYQSHTILMSPPNLPQQPLGLGADPAGLVGKSRSYSHQGCELFEGGAACVIW